MVKWQLLISDETDRSVRKFLASIGGNSGDLSSFVDEAVRREMLRQTIRSIREDNKDLSPEEAQELADEAVAWARANRT